jgi:hypothetical protein
VAPPVPIPNTEVKRCSPDGSTAIGRARVGRRQNKNPAGFPVGFLVSGVSLGSAPVSGAGFRVPRKRTLHRQAVPTHTEQIAIVTPLVAGSDPDDKAVRNAVAKDRSESLLSNTAALSR